MSVILVPILAHALAISAGERSEVRMRNDGSAQRFDLITSGQFGLHLSSKRTNWSLSYLPTLTQLSMGKNEGTLVLLHTGSLQGSIQFTRRTLVSFGQSFTYGEQYFRLISLEPTSGGANANIPSNSGGGEALPVSLMTQPNWTTQTTRFGAVTSAVTINHQLNRSWSCLARLGYNASQSFDSGTRSQLPRVQSVNTGVSFGYIASLRDRLVLRTDFSRTVTSSTRIASLAALSTDLSHILFLRTTAGVSLGVAFAQVSVPVTPSRVYVRPQIVDSPYETTQFDSSRSTYSMYPTAAAFVTSNFSIGRTLQAVGVREEAAPMVDRLTGVAVMRLITTLNASLKHNRLTVGAVGSGTNSLGSTKQPQTLRYVLALNEFVQYQLVRSWSFELGARQSLFSFSNTPESPMLWSVYFAVSYATGIIPF